MVRCNEISSIDACRGWLARVGQNEFADELILLRLDSKAVVLRLVSAIDIYAYLFVLAASRIFNHWLLVQDTTVCCTCRGHVQNDSSTSTKVEIQRGVSGKLVRRERQACCVCA